MKKFSFSLDSVLSYKNEVLESLKNEHGKLLKNVVDQENYIDSLNQQYNNCNQEFNEKKKNGITIVEASIYEAYFRQMENNLKKEHTKLEKFKELAEQKRKEVVEAKKDTSSIEKLKEKKIEEYNKEVQKFEEANIEEFVSISRIMNA